MDSTLHQLMPGLGLVQSPTFMDRLSVRAANSLARAGVSRFASLGPRTPAEIQTAPHVGPGTLEEILAAVAVEWASAYLRHDDELERRKPRALANAFWELEQMPGFQTFRRRCLDAGTPPTLAELATDEDLSRQAVSGRETRVRAALEKQMVDSDWPLRIAVDEIRHRLGSVAHLREVDDAFTALDSRGEALLRSAPHRRNMLLWLADYRLDGEWLLGPDIESLTTVILSTFANSGSSSLDAAGRQLALLGVREEVQVPWILSQHGFRAIDGKLVDTANL
jgi:Bacterial RNA polymerase, alpha chain C terminal domain